MNRIVISICCAVTALACSPADEQPHPQAEQAEQAPVPAPTTQPAEQQPALDDHAAHDQAADPSTALPAIPEGAKVSFVTPTDGAIIKGPLVDGKVMIPVKMGAQGIAVKPAGPIEAGSGHHHVLIDTSPTEPGSVVPADESHLHFGQAQTETEIGLTPGKHTLILQFADGIHRSYGPALAHVIKLTVQAEGASEVEGEGATAE